MIIRDPVHGDFERGQPEMATQTARHHYLEDLTVRSVASLRIAGAAGSLFLVEHRALGIEDRINPIGFVPCPGNPLTKLAAQFNAAVVARCICLHSSNIGTDTRS